MYPHAAQTAWGLNTINDQFLQGLGVVLPSMNKRLYLSILDACKRKLIGNKKVCFRLMQEFSRIQRKKLSTECPWGELEDMEARRDSILSFRTSISSMSTQGHLVVRISLGPGRSVQGLDGLEERQLRV